MYNLKEGSRILSEKMSEHSGISVMQTKLRTRIYRLALFQMALGILCIALGWLNRQYVAERIPIITNYLVDYTNPNTGAMTTVSFTEYRFRPPGWRWDDKVWYDGPYTDFDQINFRYRDPILVRPDGSIDLNGNFHPGIIMIEGNGTCCIIKPPPTSGGSFECDPRYSNLRLTSMPDASPLTRADIIREMDGELSLRESAGFDQTREKSLRFLWLAFSAFGFVWVLFRPSAIAVVKFLDQIKAEARSDSAES